MAHPDLEPISFGWPKNRHNNPYKDDYKEVLDHFHGKQAKANYAARVEVGLPLLPPGKPVYIIDDAHESYDESIMWEEQFKDGVRDKNDHFLLVCVYGAASGR
ncbi:hypothetical protein XANCAGTX0491_004485 [Xanthoria calcicola]